MDFMEIVRAHLNPRGFLLFNATGSDDAHKTALTAFPYGMRVDNCIAAGDSPIIFDKERFRHVLEEFRLDGEPVIDLGTPAGKQLMSEMIDYADTLSRPPQEEGLETRESVLRRTQSAMLITDDNMAAEWRQVLRFQEPP
jgi:hypothetical protein